MLNISIVLYHPKWQEEVVPLVEQLLSCRSLRKIYLIDNSEQKCVKLPISSYKLRYIFVGKNIGYGSAHNIALRESAYHQTDFHLVINSDIQVSAETIDQIHAWMEQQPQVGLLMPRVVGLDGRMQYLAKRLPAPIDVLGRRFLPAWLMRRRNARYELRDQNLNMPLNAPYLSGCFMFLRTQAAVEAGLFDERYFMYPEDIDLTRTIHREYLTLYYPQWTIVHAHAQASYKNRKMLWIHIQNMCRYFNKWGWIFDSERRSFNRSIGK